MNEHDELTQLALEQMLKEIYYAGYKKGIVAGGIAALVGVSIVIIRSIIVSYRAEMKEKKMQ